MEFSCQDEVERDDFVTIEIILFPGGITDKVEEKFEEWSLMTIFAFFAESTVENVHNGLDCVIQEDTRVVTCDKLVTDYDQLGIVLYVCSIDCTVIGADR